ncbi:MAG: ABC transporter ATP-binding protein [Acidobacteriota bacterium]|nr:ABC transporter ATP-binding protein [Acidobacteriota bacterium]
MSAFLHLDRLSKRFGELTVLSEVSLEIAEGETLALLGPSGSGKTTLLRAIAGFEGLDSGTIRVANEDVTPLQPARRGFGMVFQHYALFPHLSVGENVAFGLESRGADKVRTQSRVREALELVELDGFASRRVDQISGGQQQRVALARALAPEPRVLLLDEPLSNLDPALRERTRRQIRHAVQHVGITTVWVTHEQEEAFDVGDRVAILHRGNLEQVDSPEALYLTPRSPFVARFVGRASAIDGVWSGGEATIDIGASRSSVWPARQGEVLEEGENVTVYFRPEGLMLTAVTETGTIRGRVEERRYGGATTLYRLVDDEGRRFEVESGADAVGVGDAVGFKPRAGGPPGTAFRRRQETTS